MRDTKQNIEERHAIQQDELLTVDMLQRVVPQGRRGLITDEFVKEMNELLVDSKLRENFRENLLGFARVLGDPKFRLTDYVNAVKYVSYKMLGDSNVVAYSKVFPDRYQRLVDQKADSKTVSNFVAAYSRTQLVILITEQSLVPSYILNQDLYQKALNTQADLMLHAKSEKVRCDAANSVMMQLKMPETQKIELDVTQKDDDSIRELKEATLALARQQRELIEAGVQSAADVGKSKIIEGKVE